MNLVAPARCWGAVAGFVIFCFITTPAWSHDPGLSTATLRVRDGTLAVHLTFARADIEHLVPLDADQDGTVTAQEFQLARPGLEELARKVLKLTMDGVSVQAQTPVPQLVAADGLDFDLTYPLHGSRLGVSSELITRLARGHRQYVIVRDAQEHRLGDGLFNAAQHTLAVELPGRTTPPGTPPLNLFAGLESMSPVRVAWLFLIGLALLGAGWLARRGAGQKGVLSQKRGSITRPRL